MPVAAITWMPASSTTGSNRGTSRPRPRAVASRIVLTPLVLRAVSISTALSSSACWSQTKGKLYSTPSEREKMCSCMRVKPRSAVLMGPLMVSTAGPVMVGLARVGGGRHGDFLLLHSRRRRRPAPFRQRRWRRLPPLSIACGVRAAVAAAPALRLTTASPSLLFVPNIYCRRGWLDQPRRRSASRTAPRKVLRAIMLTSLSARAWKSLAPELPGIAVLRLRLAHPVDKMAGERHVADRLQARGRGPGCSGRRPA